MMVREKSGYNFKFNGGLRERSVPELAGTLLSGGVTVLKPLVLYGTRWEGVFDYLHTPDRRALAHPLSFLSPDDVADRWESCRRFGLTMVPMVTMTDEPADQQLALWREIAAAAGDCIEIDLEPYPEFAEKTHRQIVPMVESLAGAGNVVFLNTHLSPWTVSVLALAELVPVVDRFLGQDYWGGFNQSVAHTLGFASRIWQDLEVREWGSIVRSQDFAGYSEASALLSAAGAVEMGIWTINGATPAVYEALDAI